MSQNLSVIIPTYMREKVLWETVIELQPQLMEQDEIIIIDQNTPPLKIPASLNRPWPKLFHLKPASLTRARNLGIQKASNEFLVFLDDDILPDPELLKNIKRVALEQPNAILTGVVDQADKSSTIPTPGTINLNTGEIKTNFSRPVSGAVPFFPGGLAIIPRNCLPPPPYFCPAFIGASQGEEIDFALRIKAKGKRIISDPSIRIFHLKILEGGCRSPQFKNRFFRDQVFNEALFFGRHGLLVSTPAFLKRMKGFIEFHSRNPGQYSHRMGTVLVASTQLLRGYLIGLRGRWLGSL